MLLQEAKILGEMYLHKFGLKEWKFGFKKRRINFRSSGTCYTFRKEIRLQPQFVELNEPKIVENTILHEVAHALTIGHGHNNVWKCKALEIGCNAKRCYGKEVVKRERFDRKA